MAAVIVGVSLDAGDDVYHRRPIAVTVRAGSGNHGTRASSIGWRDTAVAGAGEKHGVAINAVASRPSRPYPCPS